jgi:hypothetical protein
MASRPIPQRQGPPNPGGKNPALATSLDIEFSCRSILRAVAAPCPSPLLSRASAASGTLVHAGLTISRLARPRPASRSSADATARRAGRRLQPVLPRLHRRRDSGRPAPAPSSSARPHAALRIRRGGRGRRRWRSKGERRVVERERWRGRRRQPKRGGRRGRGRQLRRAWAARSDGSRRRRRDAEAGLLDLALDGASCVTRPPPAAERLYRLC